MIEGFHWFPLLSRFELRHDNQHGDPLGGVMWEDRSPLRDKKNLCRAIGWDPGWCHLIHIFLCGALCLPLGLWAGSCRESAEKSLRERPWAPDAHRSSRSCNHCQKPCHFPQEWILLFTFLSKFRQVLTSEYLLSGKCLQQRMKTKVHFCRIQRPRLKSCRSKTALTFQTLPRKNTATARHGAEDVG